MAERTADRGPQEAGPKSRSQPRIGIALGAGGAKGIAHVAMLEGLDELKRKLREKMTEWNAPPA